MVTAAPPRTIRLLLIGDEEEAVGVRRVLAPAHSARYEVDSVRTYEEALAAVSARRHDAYLVSAAAGAGDPLRIVREAQPSHTGAPFIILADHADTSLEEAGADAGAAGFVVKDETEPGVLRRTLRYAISRARDLGNARQDQAAAERKSRAKDDFLSVVSHELRSPLTSIIGWSSLLRIKKFEPDAVIEGLQAIEVSAKAQAQLVDDLMDVARIVNGKIRLNLRQLDLRDVAERAAQAARPMAEAKQLSLKVAVGSDPCPVRGDPDRLQQVVANLLSNAVKFTPQGGTIRVAVRRDKDHARLAVHDTGIGIDRAMMPHVFDRLRQAAAGAGREAGLGLGLAIARELVVLHAGKLRVHSAGRGRGATFTVELPVRESR